MVRYWEEFGTIAFDPAHDTLLTACSLKNPSDTSEHPIVKCCFSFSIRRDEHKLWVAHAHPQAKQGSCIGGLTMRVAGPP